VLHRPLNVRAIVVEQRTKASPAGVAPYDSRRAWRVGLGSSVRPASLPTAAGAVGARQGCQRWRGIPALSTRRQRSIEARPHHRSAQRRRETPSAPVPLRQRGGDPETKRIRVPDWIRGNGQTSVVSISGSSIGRISATRALTQRATRRARGSVANGWTTRGTVGSKPPPLGFGERASAHRTARRNASRSCSMTRKPAAWSGSSVLAGRTRRTSAKAGARRRKLPFGIGPEQGGACECDEGRERSGSTERGSSSHVARGVGTGAKSSTRCVRPWQALHGKVPR